MLRKPHISQGFNPRELSYEQFDFLQQWLLHSWDFLNELGKNFYFGVFTLVLLQAKVLLGAWGNWDLPVWDNAHYYEKGYLFAHHGILPNDIDWSPVFSLYYSVFHSLLSSTATPLLIYTAHKAVSIFLVFIIGYIFFRLLFNPVISWLLCTYFILLSFGAVNFHVVHYFVLAAMMGFAIVASASNKVHMNLIVGVLTIIIALIRPEFILAIPAWCILSTLYDVYSGKIATLSNIIKVVYFTCIIMLGVLAPAYALSKDSGRSWLAFGQHYALGYCQRHPEWGKEPFANWEEPVKISFGKADSLIAAVKSNPGAVVEHLVWNMKIFIGEFNATLRTFPIMGMGINGLYLFAFLFATSIFAGLFLIASGQNIITASAPLKHYAKMFIFISVLLLTTLFSVFLIYPLNKFLIQLLPVYLIILGILISIIFKVLPTHTRMNALVPALVIVCMIIFPTPYKILKAQPVADITTKIAQIPAKVSFVLSGRGRGLCVYSNIYKCRYYNLIGSNTPLGELIQTQNIMVLVISEEQRRLLSANQREELAALEASPEDAGWCRVHKNSLYDLYIRKDFQAARTLMTAAGCSF